MINARFKPIEKWPKAPTPAHKRQASRFSAGWNDTLNLLERELGHLKAKDIVIEGFFQPKDIRNDGWPKSSARPGQPGIVLSFASARGAIQMPCDRFTDWESNVRAVALTLEHLRAVDRYGVTTDANEQYTGWLQLPAASATDEATECARVLCRLARLADGYIATVARSEADAKSAYRQAAQYTHPDKTGGVASKEFQEAVSAYARLKTLRGWI